MALAQVDPDNARIWGSDDDYVAFAPPGSADDLTITEIKKTAPSPFIEVGWLGPDGPGLTPSDEIKKLKGFQGGRVIRTKVTSSETQLKFIALESTINTVGMALDLRETATTGGVSKSKAGARRVIKKSWIVGQFDGDIGWLWVIPEGEIGERAEVKLGREDITGWELTVEVIGDYYLYTNDPAFTGVTP